MVKKRIYPSGQETWRYCFEHPSSTRSKRKHVYGAGFETRKAAIDAEAKRRIEVQAEFEAQQCGAVAPLPKSLGQLLEEFCQEHGERELAPKTVARYRDMILYLEADLLKLPLPEVTPLHLKREWNRLLDAGGHFRGKTQTRPLAPKTVRNIAGVVSSAFSRAIKWGIANFNPVTNSEPPTFRRPEAAVYTPNQQNLLMAASEAHWALPMILELASAMGARRGEVLALRWSDIRDGRAHVVQSLGQVRDQVFFKDVKTPKSRRPIALPESTLELLEQHRKEQEKHREHFGPDYRTDLDLILCERDGSPLKPDSISATVSRYRKKVKLPKGSLHAFRHSHASLLLAGGVPLPEVSARLGHSNVYVTATVYAHALPGRDEEVARKFDEIRGRQVYAESTRRPSEKGKDAAN